MIRTMINQLISPPLEKFAPIWWKERHELKYWKKRKAEEKHLSNAYYKPFYTDHFGLNEDYYTDKVILDIGCGPRGSLEWAHAAKRRIGLDPLADKYLKLGAATHDMEYMKSGSESIPLPDSYCDVVCSFNSLDHVHDVKETAAEIKRILNPQGIFLLLVEVNHKATTCEPHELTPIGVLDLFGPQLQCKNAAVYIPSPAGLYQSITEGKLYSDPLKVSNPGWFSGIFEYVC